MTDFDALYRSTPDPWNVRESWYERRKSEILLSSLPQESYGLALELGCGMGHLTIRLAQRCEKVMAIDVSQTAIDRCLMLQAQAQVSNVETLVMNLPDEWPTGVRGHCSLIVVSELAYYMHDEAVATLFERCAQALSDQGDWVMCHFLPNFHDRLQETHALHERLAKTYAISHVVSHLDTQFLLDIWTNDMRGSS